MSDLLRTLDALAGLWLPALLRAGWQGGLAIFAAWAVSRRLTRVSPSATCWLWRLVFLKLIVSLFWTTPLEITIGSRRLVQPDPASIIASQPPLFPMPGKIHTNAAQTLPANALPVAAARPTWPALLLVLWGLGATASALSLAADWRRTRRLIRAAKPVGMPLLEAELTELCRRMGIRGAPRLLTDAQVGTPMLFGGRHPAIALPVPTCRESTLAELRLVLAHELAHLRRRDLLWAWLPNLTRLLFFFHPLVWVAEREWRLAHEVACDAEALRVTDARPAAYAAMLIKMVDPAPGASHSGLVTAAVAESYESIQRRLLAMKHAEGRSRKWSRIVGLAVAVAGCVAVVPWRVTAEPTVSFALERTLEIPGGALWPLAFSPDGRRVACAAARPGSPSAVELYDTSTGDLRQTFPTGGYRPCSISYSPDGALVAVGIQHTEDDGVSSLQVWETGTGRMRHSIPGPNLTGEVVATAFSPDGKTLAASGVRGCIRLLDPQTGALRKTLPEAGPRYSTFSLAFSPDGKNLASVAYPTRLEFSGGGNEIEPWLTPIKVWDPETGELKRTLKTNSHRVQQLTFAADGRTLAAACDFSSTQLWNVNTGELETTLGGGWWMHPHDIANLRVEEGRLKGQVTGAIPYLVLPLQHVQPDEVREVRIRMRVTGKGDGMLWWCTATSPTFGPDKRMPFSIPPDGQFHDVTVPVGEHAQWKGQEVFTIKIDPNHNAPGTEFAIASVVGVGEREHPFPLKIGDGVERGLVRSVGVMPDSRVVVSGSWAVVLWDRTTGRRLGRLNANGLVLRLSPDGKLLAAGLPNQKLGLWRLK